MTVLPRLCRDGDAVPPELAGAVVAIGNFDGIHQGHRHLIAATRREADTAGRASAVFTFDPHPRVYFNPNTPFFDLTPLDIKLKLFGRMGLDGVFVRRFDAALAGLSPDEFVADLLVGHFRASALVVGGDFHFGRGRAGTPVVLAELARRHGLSCSIVDLVANEGTAVSSSRIRAALETGDVADANQLLGYRWFVAGTVAHGDKRGRVLGYPTANLRLSDGCRLARGIYAVRFALGPGLVANGVASFGSRPTFDDGAPLLEVHLFDFAGDLYGRRVEVEFVEWIRPEERFASADELILQMDRDSERAREALGRPTGDLASYIG